MPDVCVKVARGLLLHGERLEKEGDMTKRQFLQTVGVKDTTFRAAGERIGAKEHDPGLRFFDASDRKLTFGPGAGLVLGVSIGSETLRGAIVDANGRLLHRYQAESQPEQLRSEPRVLLDRIRDAAAAVLSQALGQDALLVDGRLPLLGVAVAWPTAIDRRGHPVGGALSHRSWNGGQSLRQRVGRHLGIDPVRSHALNDVDAAALGVAYELSRERTHLDQIHPELTLVLRLAGGVGGATVIVEPPENHENWGMSSGFLRTVLIGGVDRLAGELGHVGVPAATIDLLNTNRPDSLGALEPYDCSCAEPGKESVPPHLEAYTSVSALAHRVAPTSPASDTLSAILQRPEDPVHSRALADIGHLVGEALLAPVAWLNPASVVLTGSLATPAVARAVDAELADAHPIVTHPNVRCLSGEESPYARVKGAALAVLRRHVFREIPSLLGGPKKTLPSQIGKLNIQLTRLPWD